MAIEKAYGILARFQDPSALLKAAKNIREAGYKNFDCHSPFPIHGMDQAMGLKRSPLGWIVGACAICGGSAALGLQWWTHAIEYPIVISGKPFFSFQAFVLITFALAVLGGAVAATFGMLTLNRLPRFHNHLFYSKQFETTSDNCFFVSIDACDQNFDDQQSGQFLESIGGYDVELIKES